MKKLIYFLLILGATVACTKSSDTTEPSSKNDLQQNYLGKVTVTYTPAATETNPNPSEETHIDEGRLLFVTFSEDGTTASVFFHKVKFSNNPREPQSDITVPNISVSGTKDNCTLTLADGDPLYAGNPYPRFHVTGLTGTIKDKTFTLSLRFGNYPTLFSGSLTEMTEYPE